MHYNSSQGVLLAKCHAVGGGGCQTKSGGNVKPRVEGHAQKGIHNALQKDFFAEGHTREVSPTAPGGEVNLRVEGETSQLMEGGPLIFVQFHLLWM